MVEQILAEWRKHSAFQWVVKAALIFGTVALILTLHRYYTFYASYDQGIFNQVFWNGTQGRFFESSLSSALSASVVHQNQLPEVFYHRLGQHFTPALLVWLPLYSLFPSPITLTVLQVGLVTVAGLVLYSLARHYLAPSLSAWITVSFYGANAVIGPTLSNFHDISQLPLYTFGLFWALEKRRWPVFALCMVLILAVREDSGVGLFGVGMYLILSRRYPQLGLMVCTLSFSYLLAVTNVIMPLFSDDISQRFMMERFGQYVEGDEASTVDIIGAMVTNPWKLVVELLTPFWGTLKYLLGQWLPLAFIPAIAPGSWVIAGFPLLKLFLAKGESVLAITIRYAMTVVPGLFYGSVLWWASRSRPGGALSPQPLTVAETATPPALTRRFRQFWMVCICLSLFFTVTSNPNRTLSFLIPDSVSPWVYVPLTRQWDHAGQVWPLLRQIPSDASVAATTYLIPPLSGRRQVLRFPQYQLVTDERQVAKVEYVIADLWQLREYQVAFSSDRKRLKSIVELIGWLSESGEYGIIDWQDGVIMMRRGATSQVEAVAKWKEFEAQVKSIFEES